MNVNWDKQMSFVTVLENVVHEHSKHLKKSKTLRLEPFDDASVKRFRKYVRKLKELSMKLDSILRSMMNYDLEKLDQDSLSRLDLLTFFVYEVSTNEEIDFWNRMHTYEKELAELSIVIEKEVERVNMTKTLAKNINESIQFLLQKTKT